MPLWGQTSNWSLAPRKDWNAIAFTFLFFSYDRRRIIVRQGHSGFSFFFIVSGSVSVTITRKDEKTGIDITNTVDVLVKNDAFGVKYW